MICARRPPGRFAFWRPSRRARSDPPPLSGWAAHLSEWLKQPTNSRPCHMPRGGSKKGERRGGRKPGSRNKATEERMQEVAIALGKAEIGIMPREMMLQGMRHFFEMAMTCHAEVNRLLAEAENGGPGELRELAVQAEARFEKYMILAGDLAYKAAPYLHARLQAIHVSGGQDKPQANVIAALLQEINSTMRERPGLLINGRANGHTNGSGTEH